MMISLIAAMASNRVIGHKGSIPWTIPGEQHRFKQITLNHTVLMGRKTHESIGHPLPQRTNIVITRQTDYKAPGCIIAEDLLSALEMCPEDEEELFICGGEELYTAALAFADRIYLSVLHREVSGDRYFPEFSLEKFQKVTSEYIRGQDPYTFIIYDRIGQRPNL
ncbi:MAG: dihydrofolate reductase [Candidatus Brocadiaceae bacterium]|nr:dihydrofolate reductase [Candidatus Brocadiaceae bacterium]